MIVDANAYIGNWPFRKLLYRTAHELLALMDRVGIDRAVVSSFDTIFLKEYSRGNRDLSEETAPHSERLFPFACIHFDFPGWERDLRIAVDELAMRGVSIYPNYHDYDLKQNAARIARAVRDANRTLPLFLFLRLEDQRRAHWLCRVPDVPVEDAAALLNETKELPVIIAGIKAPEVKTLLEQIDPASCNAFFEISGMESLSPPVERVVEWVGAERVLFGTYMPFKYPETALLKFRHSGLTEQQQNMILYENLLNILNTTE
jgi:predicted TIM-barrel fold metal-dependent hydrolase